MDSMALLEALENARMRLLEAIESLDDDALLQPNAIGRLSVRDLLVLISVWESELVTGLMQLRQGKKPARLLEALADREAYNRRVLAENEGRGLDIIFDDLQGVYVQLERWLDEFSDRQLADPAAYQVLNGRPLWRLIRAASFGLEEQYAGVLELFAAQHDHVTTEQDDGSPDYP